MSCSGVESDVGQRDLRPLRRRLTLRRRRRRGAESCGEIEDPRVVERTLAVESPVDEKARMGTHQEGRRVPAARRRRGALLGKGKGSQRAAVGEADKRTFKTYKS